MYKYFKMLLTVLLLCLNLVACSNKEDIDNSVIDEKFDNTSNEVVYVVNISINPEFELDLDNAGYIIDFHCLNEDAKKAFENINVLESYCEVGINELLNVANDKGYLVSNSEIEVISYVSENCTISEILKNNIEGTLKNCQSIVDFTYSHKVIDNNGNVLFVDNGEVENNELIPNGSESNENPSTDIEFDENRFIEVERDENGNVIKTVEIDNHNKKLTRYYNSHGTMICENIEDTSSILKRIFDDNGILLREENHDNNGNYAITDFDKKGNIEQETEVLTDGLSIVRYYSFGILDKVEQVSPEGKEVAYYDSNGVVEKVITTSNDGTIHTMIYVNGVISTDEWTDPNTGISAVATYNNGVIASHIKNGNNGFYEYIYYDANGTITEVLDLDIQGRDRKKLYSADGTYSEYLLINGKWVEVDN